MDDLLPALAHEPAASTARLQASLATSFLRSGRGLHTGKPAIVRVGPAPVGTGIVFQRTLPGGRTVDVPALWRFQETQPGCSALRHDGVLIRTVEHLMASLYALRIDNAVVEIDAEELPIFDGSAVPWCEGIAAAGRAEQDVPVRTIRVLREVGVADGCRRLAIRPARGLSVEASIALRHLGASAWRGAICPLLFPQEIAPSRSFARFVRVMAGRAYGFAFRKPLLQGCSPRSAALLFRDRVIGGLRMPDELVKHRVMDIVGDLALAGHPLDGHVVASHTCHTLNHTLVAALMRNPDAWELV
jgi:UDP-3-O-[3-hydroxymyristoyl] N-acetylglucosamine deacetylase